MYTIELSVKFCPSESEVQRDYPDLYPLYEKMSALRQLRSRKWASIYHFAFIIYDRTNITWVDGSYNNKSNFVIQVISPIFVTF